MDRYIIANNVKFPFGLKDAPNKNETGNIILFSDGTWQWKSDLDSTIYACDAHFGCVRNNKND